MPTQEDTKYNVLVAATQVGNLPGLCLQDAPKKASR